MRGLLAELNRRNVTRVAAAYAVGGWLVTEVASVVLPTFGAPDWVLRVLIGMLAIGFPIVLFISWVFELTPEGVRRESEIQADQSITAHTAKKLDIAVIVMLALAIGFLFFQGKTIPPESPAGVSVSPTAEPIQAESLPENESPSEASAAQTAEVSEPPRESIAVLPFVNMSSNTENEYFSDGLTETLLHKLAQVSRLRVAARTSSFAFKGTATDIREIADKLSVANVLEGSVQRAGDTVRITAQLIQASDGYHLWSATYDRSLDDIFQVQDEIAAEVATALQASLQLDESEQDRSDGGTTNTAAYDLYLRGLEALRDHSEQSLAEAERQFRRALDLDPEFALAWSWLAIAIREHGYYSGANWDSLEDQMVAAAEKGVALAPDNSTTVAVLGIAMWQMGEYIEAKRILERAVALDPNNAYGWNGLANVLFNMSQFDAALDAASRAMALDPLDMELKAESTYKFMNAGRIGEAEALARSILEAVPDSVLGHSALGNIYWRTARQAEAFREYYRLLEINPNTGSIMGRISRSYFLLGDVAGSQRWLSRLSEIEPKWGHSLRGRNCHLVGDRDCAKDNYQRALDLEIEEEDRLNLMADLAWVQEDWPAVLEALEPRIRKARERGDNWTAVNDSSLAALAADRLGRIELRDRHIDFVIEQSDRAEKQGNRSQYGPWGAARAYALSGDAEGTYKQLSLAIERGAQDLPFVLNSGIYDKVLDDPKIIELLEQLRADNWRALQELQAAEAELEGSLGS